MIKSNLNALSHVLFIALACIMIRCGASAADAVVQPITSSDDTARLRVEVMVNKTTPLPFLVDTASTRSVIANSVAEKLGLPKGKTLKVINIGGVDKTPSVIISELRFSSIEAHNVIAPSLPRGNIGADGIVGLDMLKKQRMVIDFLHHDAITLLPVVAIATQHENPDDPNTIIVNAKSRTGELIITNAEIEGHPIAVIIDTGSESSVGNAALRELAEHRIAHGTIQRITLLSVTGREIPGEYTAIGRVTIGDVAIANLPLVFADVQTFRQFGLERRPAILLGMETLRLFDKITLDFLHKKIGFVLSKKDK